MYEHVATLHAPADRRLYVWFEPWAEGLGFQVVRSFEDVVPDPGPRLSVREATTLLFGPPPVPTPDEGAPP